MPTPPADDSHTPHLALLASLAVELAPVCKALGLQRRGSLMVGQHGGAAITAAVTGMGGSRMTRAAAALMARHRLTGVLLVGFAGALDAGLRTGDILQIARVKFVEPDRDTWDCTVVSAAIAQQGTLITCEQIISSPLEKSNLRQRSGADAVDMETWHLARLCHERGLPLTVLRAISDTADTTLPAWTANLTTADGRPAVGRAIGHLLTHPQHLSAMLNLRSAANRCGKALGEAASATIDALAG